MRMPSPVDSSSRCGFASSNLLPQVIGGGHQAGLGRRRDPLVGLQFVQGRGLARFPGPCAASAKSASVAKSIGPGQRHGVVAANDQCGSRQPLAEPQLPHLLRPSSGLPLRSPRIDNRDLVSSRLFSNAASSFRASSRQRLPRRADARSIPGCGHPSAAIRPEVAIATVRGSWQCRRRDRRRSSAPGRLLIAPRDCSGNSEKARSDCSRAFRQRASVLESCSGSYRIPRRPASNVFPKAQACVLRRCSMRSLATARRRQLVRRLLLLLFLDRHACSTSRYRCWSARARACSAFSRAISR